MTESSFFKTFFKPTFLLFTITYKPNLPSYELPPSQPPWPKLEWVNRHASQLVHLSMFCFVLFCLYDIYQPGCFKLCSWCLWNKEGCMGLVSWHLDLGCKSSWILMTSSLKIKLNCSWNFQRNWNMPLMFLERSWWAGFNGIHLVRFGFRMWQILVSKLKIQINSKKPGFGRKNRLRTW